MSLQLSYLPFPAIYEEKKSCKARDVKDQDFPTSSGAMKLSEIERNSYLINQRKFIAQQKEKYKGKVKFEDIITTKLMEEYDFAERLDIVNKFIKYSNDFLSYIRLFKNCLW